MISFFKDLITIIFNPSSKRLKKLRKNPTSKELAGELHRDFAEKPLQFIKAFFVALFTLREGRDETKRPGSNEEIFRQTWENTIHKERVQPLQYLIPDTKGELINIVKKAEEEGLYVRAVGKGHSFSDVSNATDILVDTLGLKHILELDKDTLKSSLPTLVNCEAGILVEDLNTYLDEKGLALPTMAAFDQETIYGAIATSTHGTGIRVSGMSDMLKSMDLVANNGKVYRLEPHNGPTDPVKFQEKYPDGEIVLIQDDAKFKSSVVGFGLMGIVYSILIEPVKTFYLKQRLWVSNWSKIKPKLEDRSFFTEINPKGDKIEKDPVTGEYPPTRAQVFVNPYKTKKIWDPDEDHTCVVQVQTEITKEEYEQLKKEEPKKGIEKIKDFVELFLSNGGYGVHEEDIEMEDKESKLEEILVDFVLAFLNTYPLLTPQFLDISMIVLLSGSGKIGKSYVVMNQGKLAIKNAGYSVEPGFAVDADNNFISGTEEIFKVAETSEESCAYLSSPICLRFVKASNDYMSPEYMVDTCMIDVPSVLGTVGADEMMDRMQLALLPKGARPHWGKICNLVNGQELIKEMYPEFEKFLETANFFNPNGTFNSVFSSRTGISEIDFKRS